MRYLATTDTTRFDEVLQASSNWNWTSQISYDVVASLLRMQSFIDAEMRLYIITADYNDSLEAAHALFGDDRYDTVR